MGFGISFEVLDIWRQTLDMTSTTLSCVCMVLYDADNYFGLARQVSAFIFVSVSAEGTRRVLYCVA